MSLFVKFFQFAAGAAILGCPLGMTACAESNNVQYVDQLDRYTDGKSSNGVVS